MAAEDQSVVAEVVPVAEASARPKSDKPPVLFEFHAGGVDATLEVASLDPLKGHFDVHRDHEEVVHVEVRAVKGAFGLGEIMANPAAKQVLVSYLGAIVVALKDRNAPDTAEGETSGREVPPDGPDPMAAVRERGERASKAAREAARAKAEELGVLPFWEATEAINAASGEAYHAAYTADDEAAEDPAPEAAE